MTTSTPRPFKRLCLTVIALGTLGASAQAFGQDLADPFGGDTGISGFASPSTNGAPSFSPSVEGMSTGAVSQAYNQIRGDLANKKQQMVNTFKKLDNRQGTRRTPTGGGTTPPSGQGQRQSQNNNQTTTTPSQTTTPSESISGFGGGSSGGNGDNTNSGFNAIE